MRRFVDFPTDVLLYLLGCLELENALLLLSTCTRLRKLSHNRSVWINILRRIQSEGSRTLACPIQQHFSQLSLSELQKIVHRTVRLQKNWSREEPCIIGAVSAVRCEGIDGPFWILTVIPGTNILVLYDDSQLLCYDLSTTTSSLSLRIGGMDSYAQFSEHGKYFIGIFHVLENACLLDVLCVEYGPGASPILRKVYQRVNPATTLMHDCLDVFMHATIVGMIYRDFTPQQLRLLAIDIHTNASITIPLSGLSDLLQTPLESLSCLVQGSYVYITVQTESCTCHLFRCDISAPWDNAYTDGRFDPSPSAIIEPLDPRLTGGGRYRPTPCQLLQPVGLTALYADTYANPITTTVLFQPDIFSSSRQTDTLRLDLLGDLRFRPSDFSTDSGNYLLLCTVQKNNDNDHHHHHHHDDNNDDDNDNHNHNHNHNDDDDDDDDDDDNYNEMQEDIYVLYLVHFVKGPPALIRVLKLDMPYFIESELLHGRIQSMAVDDHLGVVYLTCKQGYIFAVPFA